MLKIEIRVSLAAAPPGMAPEMVVCPCCDGVWADFVVEGLPLPTRQGGVGVGAGAGAGASRATGPRLAIGYQNDGPPQRVPPHGPTAAAGGAGGGMAGWPHHATPGPPPSSSSSSAPSSSDYSAAVLGIGVSKKGAAAKKFQNSTTNSGRGAGRGLGPAGAGAGAGAGDGFDVAPPLCQCGEPAVMRITKKEGPNKDRPFYCCTVFG